jgi:signal transduction histidine kinase
LIILESKKMNKNISLKKISQLALTLQDVQSLAQLDKAIIHEALDLTHAAYGVLFVYEHGKLQKTYCSSHLLKFIKKNYLKKALHTRQIVIEQKESLNKSQPQLGKHGIISEALIPMRTDKDELCRILVLYAQEEKFFTPQLVENLNIFRTIATLAMRKVHLRDKLEKALETRDHFISLASHELRTPLTSINGYIQLLHNKMEKNDTQESRWITALHTESIRMTNLVKELLDVNRIKQGQFAFIFNEVSLYDIIQKAISRHTITHIDNPIIFKNNISNNKYTITGDFDKLVEMVSGILSNAVKFSKPNAQIKVSLSSTSRTLSLSVQNVGRTITKQDLTAIFEGFYKSKHPGAEGMGVGLFLAKHIIANHRGKIQVISNKNEGSTVKVTLPITRG